MRYELANGVSKSKENFLRQWLVIIGMAMPRGGPSQKRFNRVNCMRMSHNWEPFVSEWKNSNSSHFFQPLNRLQASFILSNNKSCMKEKKSLEWFRIILKNSDCSYYLWSMVVGSSYTMIIIKKYFYKNSHKRFNYCY